MTNFMTKSIHPQHANIITELLTNAGYIDDADELLGDLIGEIGVEDAMVFADELDELIAAVNEAVSEDQRLHPTQTMRQVVESLM